jgi:hypothetical protein
MYSGASRIRKVGGRDGFKNKKELRLDKIEKERQKEHKKTLVDTLKKNAQKKDTIGSKQL